MKWALLLLMMWSLPVLGQPVLRYNAKTVFAKDGYLNTYSTFREPLLNFSFDIGSRGGNKNWDFSKFPATASSEIYHKEYPHSLYKYAPTVEMYDAAVWSAPTKYRVSDYGLTQFAEDEKTGVDPHLYLKFPFKCGQYNTSGSFEIVSGARKIHVPADTICEGYGWGKLITPYRSYPSTLLVKWSTLIFDTLRNIRDTQFVSTCRISYKWYQEADGQFLFAVDSFTKTIAGRGYHYTNTDASASYYSRIPFTTLEPILLNIYQASYSFILMDEATFSVINDEQPDLCFSIKNVFGLEVLPRQCIPKNEEWTTIKFRTADLPAGLYFVNVVGKDRWHYQRLWVNHY